jgi:preprotein translocase subunit SecD
MRRPTVRSDVRESTRRRALAATGTLLVAGLAGCVGDDGTDESGDGAERTESTDDGMGSDDREQPAVSLVGIPVGTNIEGVDVDDEAVADRLWEETDLDFHEVAVDPDESVVEFYTDISDDDARSALETVGVDTTDATVNTGITAKTRDEMRETVAQRLEDIDVDISTIDHEGQPAIGFTGPAAEESTLTDTLSAQPIQIVVSYPDPETGDSVTETVLTSDDFQEVGEPATGAQPPHIPVELTDEAAERFVEVMTEAGFTSEGIGNCSFDAATDDPPNPDEHCLLTRVDGEYQYGASMSSGLAETIEGGEFQANPSFILTTQDFSRAEQLAATLQEVTESGALPTVLEYDSTE